MTGGQKRKTVSSPSGSPTRTQSKDQPEPLPKKLKNNTPPAKKTTPGEEKATHSLYRVVLEKTIEHEKIVTVSEYVGNKVGYTSLEYANYICMDHVLKNPILFRHGKYNKEIIFSTKARRLIIIHKLGLEDPVEYLDHIDEKGFVTKRRIYVAMRGKVPKTELGYDTTEATLDKWSNTTTIKPLTPSEILEINAKVAAIKVQKGREIRYKARLLMLDELAKLHNVYDKAFSHAVIRRAGLSKPPLGWEAYSETLQRKVDAYLASDGLDTDIDEDTDKDGSGNKESGNEKDGESEEGESEEDSGSESDSDTDSDSSSDSESEEKKIRRIKEEDCHEDKDQKDSPEVISE